MTKHVLFLVGPTGSGKSAVAFALAKALHGEIISCDSMQVYKGMDIGTAKPSSKERRSIRHHLIDVMAPGAECSVFKHRALALKAIERLLKKGKLSILVGGSGLYLKALLDGLAPQPGKASGIRNRLAREAKRRGLGALYRRLAKIDPSRARAIHAHDERRIIRALEIWERSRKNPTEWARETEGLAAQGIQSIVFGLLRPRAELYQRINQRVDEMIARGWMDEVKRLAHKRLSKTARAAIGYQEILEYLRKKRTHESAIMEIKKRTRHLAKKQMTWFRKDARIRWIPVSGNNFVRRCIRIILRELRYS